MEQNITFAIITCSDTRGMKEDTAGAALETLIAENGWECKSHVVVPDERPFIASAIVRACDEQDVDVVLTCGGSGLSLRDVTPEATMDACDRNVPGIAEAMRAHSLAITPYAMLSRALCMQRGRHLVINLPGSEKAARENSGRRGESPAARREDDGRRRALGTASPRCLTYATELSYRKGFFVRRGVGFCLRGQR